MKEASMNREPVYICSDVSSVNLDEGLEAGTLTFVADEESEPQLTIRLPVRAIVALRDALLSLSEDPAQSRRRSANSSRFDPAFSLLEEDLGEIRRRDENQFN
jgi:hypothetical protein